MLLCLSCNMWNVATNASCSFNTHVTWSSWFLAPILQSTAINSKSTELIECSHWSQRLLYVHWMKSMVHNCMYIVHFNQLKATQRWGSRNSCIDGTMASKKSLVITDPLITIYAIRLSMQKAATNFASTYGTSI